MIKSEVFLAIVCVEENMRMNIKREMREIKNVAYQNSRLKIQLFVENHFLK